MAFKNKVKNNAMIQNERKTGLNLFFYIILWTESKTSLHNACINKTTKYFFTLKEYRNIAETDQKHILADTI